MRTPVRDNRLTPRELESAPELAALAVLESTLDIATHVLFAANPDLADDERPYWIDQPPSHDIAKRIATFADRLRNAIAEYRKVLAREHQAPESSDKDIDF